MKRESRKMNSDVIVLAIAASVGVLSCCHRDSDNLDMLQNSVRPRGGGKQGAGRQGLQKSDKVTTGNDVKAYEIGRITTLKFLSGYIFDAIQLRLGDGSQQYLDGRPNGIQSKAASAGIMNKPGCMARLAEQLTLSTTTIGKPNIDICYVYMIQEVLQSDGRLLQPAVLNFRTSVIALGDQQIGQREDGVVFFEAGDHKSLDERHWAMVGVGNIADKKRKNTALLDGGKRDVHRGNRHRYSLLRLPIGSVSSTHEPIT